jgi:uncharacterized protein (DUF2141 family)
MDKSDLRRTNHAAPLRPFLRLETLVLAALAVSTATAVRADTPPSAVLTVRLSQLRSNEGQAGCNLYNTAKGFPIDPALAAQKRWCTIANKTSTCSFDPIPAGIYAVACIHDENKNGKLDTGPFGNPKEGTVVSNHAKGFMGPPSFDKAKFQFAGVASTLDLRMGY